MEIESDSGDGLIEGAPGGGGGGGAFFFEFVVFDETVDDLDLVNSADGLVLLLLLLLLL